MIKPTLTKTFPLKSSTANSSPLDPSLKRITPSGSVVLNIKLRLSLGGSEDFTELNPQYFIYFECITYMTEYHNKVEIIKQQ